MLVPATLTIVVVTVDNLLATLTVVVAVDDGAGHVDCSCCCCRWWCRPHWMSTSRRLRDSCQRPPRVITSSISVTLLASSREYCWCPLAAWRRLRSWLDCGCTRSTVSSRTVWLMKTTGEIYMVLLLPDQNHYFMHEWNEFYTHPGNCQYDIICHWQGNHSK